MTIKRVNSTGRKKINSGDIRIVMQPGDGTPSFRANFHFAGYGLPGNAQIFVEAWRLTTLMRFPYGTVTHPQPVGSLPYTLTDFSTPEGVRFRVKVTSVHPTPGLLLASGEVRPHISSDLPESPDSLLPPHPGPLGDDVWQIQFDPADRRPALVVNERLTNWRDTVADPVFRALVFPAALRTVLHEIGPEGGDEVDEDDAFDWVQKWIQFAELMSGNSKPTGVAVEEDFDGWVDSVVAGFTRKHSIFHLYQPASAQDELE